MSKTVTAQLFDEMKKAQKKGTYSSDMTKCIDNSYQESIQVLLKSKEIQLISNVPTKQYIAFERGTKFSRAINKTLFNLDYSKWQKFLSLLQSDQLHLLPITEISSILYSVAISFCSTIDLLSTGDQKTPGTFFEYFIAYFFSWRLDTTPQNRIQIRSLDDEASILPTDYIFNLGKGERKFHMPVKTSSRERAIMLWAHQKLIDGVYGTGRFMGTPVLLQETKVNKLTKRVDEICLPGQWQLYQLYIAKLSRIYYLDPPQAYLNLSNNFPPLYVKPFAEFFFEWDTITPL